MVKATNKTQKQSNAKAKPIAKAPKPAKPVVAKLNKRPGDKWNLSNL